MFDRDRGQLAPFTTDGCSGWMSWFWRHVLGHPPPWEGHCIEHDRLYHVGGSWLDRLRADWQLMLNVLSVASGRLGICWIMLGAAVDDMRHHVDMPYYVRWWVLLGYATRDLVLGLLYSVIAIGMFAGVRLGGTPFLPLPWRWGYGWRYPRWRQ